MSTSVVTKNRTDCQTTKEEQVQLLLSFWRPGRIHGKAPRLSLGSQAKIIAKKEANCASQEELVDDGLPARQPELSE